MTKYAGTTLESEVLIAPGRFMESATTCSHLCFVGCKPVAVESTAVVAIRESDTISKSKALPQRLHQKSARQQKQRAAGYRTEIASPPP